MAGPVTISTHKQQIRDALDELYQQASSKYAEKTEEQTSVWNLPIALLTLLDQFWGKGSGRAESAITNLTTCLVAKVVEPDIDCRYHREPKNTMPSPPDGPTHYFAGRTISEQLVAPWLKDHDFVTSNSGWQTRTFERPRPYTIDYEENIQYVKTEFLHILDQVQRGQAALARETLTCLLFKQIEQRENQRIQLTIPNITSIETIAGFFRRHFSAPYSQRGASRLPVLAIYAIYRCVMTEVERYNGYYLAPLQSHEAADARTGSVGDIEILDGDPGGDSNARIFEAFEIKYEVPIDREIIRNGYDKFRGHPTLKRYYILTTADPSGGQDRASLELIRRIRDSHGAEVIVNGVLPTIKYFLRLLKNPASIFPEYVKLLAEDPSLAYEHRQKWNEVVIEV